MKEISAKEAFDRLNKDGSVVYLDVRSGPEFKAGRPRGAEHVALMERDVMGRMAPNPDFLDQVKNKFPADRDIICGCQMGGRSARAVQILEAAGYSRVWNMRGGFSGAKDPQSGEVLEPGWTQLGFPTEEG